MGRLAAKIATSKPALVVIMATLLLGTGPFSSHAYAADLVPRALRLSNSVADATGVTYTLDFTYATTATIGSVAIQFCLEGPLPATPCSTPPGFSASAALLATQSGAAGFSIYSGSTANEIILTRPPANINAGTASTYSFISMVNPSDDGALFVRVLTYASSDATGSPIDTGGLVLAINQRPTINAEVPPYLLFCLGESISGFNCATATEPFSDMGTLTPVVTSAAQSQMVIATNAASGYSLWVLGPTMTSGNNTLPAMNGGVSQEGTSQFGINLRANGDPIIGEDPSGPGGGTIQPGYGTPNVFRFQSGDALASAVAPDDFRKYTVSYIVNVDDDQPGGVYSTTLTYVTLANF